MASNKSMVNFFHLKMQKNDLKINGHVSLNSQDTEALALLPFHGKKGMIGYSIVVKALSMWKVVIFGFQRNIKAKYLDKTPTVFIGLKERKLWQRAGKQSNINVLKWKWKSSLYWVKLGINSLLVHAPEKTKTRPGEKTEEIMRDWNLSSSFSGKSAKSQKSKQIF